MQHRLNHILQHGLSRFRFSCVVHRDRKRLSCFPQPTHARAQFVLIPRAGKQACFKVVYLERREQMATLFEIDFRIAAGEFSAHCLIVLSCPRLAPDVGVVALAVLCNRAGCGSIASNWSFCTTAMARMPFT